MNQPVEAPGTGPARIRNTDWLFTILVAVAFWGWLAKDFLLDFFVEPMKEGKLVATVAVLLVPLFVSAKLPGLNRARSIPQPPKRTLLMIFVFFFYCTISGFLSGNDAFTRFKLLNLLISIGMAYALAGKTIRAIAINKTHFLAVGILIGTAARFLIYSELSSHDRVLGLREVSMAHLNVQDFYVLLFLGVTALLFSGPFRLTRLLVWAGTSAISLPAAIALNSRMLPFTLGMTLVYMAVAMRSVMLRRANVIRNLVLLLAVTAAGASLANRSIDSESRMMSIYQDGVLETFADDPRAISFAEAVDNFLAAPIEGIGFGKFIFPGGFTDPTDRASGFWAHNIFLELLSELGLIGFFLFMIPFGPTLKKILLAKFGHNNESVVFPALSLVYVVVTMQLTQNIYYPVLWLIYLCCEAALRRADWHLEERMVPSVERAMV